MKAKLVVCLCAVGLLAGMAQADVKVFPTLPHAAYNYIPFSNGACTMHQVFAASLFSNATGGLPAQIEAIAFAPNPNLAGQQMVQPVAINLGYTNRVPGQPSPAGLSVPVAGGGGAPNAVGPVSTFYNNPNFAYTIVSGGPENFELKFIGTPFLYDPAQGNLLVEIVTTGPSNFINVSRSAGGAEASRSYVGGTWTGESTTTATRMQFTYTPIPEPASVLLLSLVTLLRRR